MLSPLHGESRLLTTPRARARRTAQYAATQLGSEANAIQKQIGEHKKAKRDAEAQALVAARAAKLASKRDKEAEAAAKFAHLLTKVRAVGNYVHPSVVESADEAHNNVLRAWAPDAAPPRPRGADDGALPHHGVLARLDGYDAERGVKIVGHRGYCLTGYGLFLNLALINYGLEFLFNKGCGTRLRCAEKRACSWRQVHAQPAALLHAARPDGQDSAVVRL